LYQGTFQCIKKNEGGEIRPLSLKKILKIFKKTIDKSQQLWYNKDNPREKERGKRNDL
jgi:hypothetical protein